jgi:hypothetical protein
MSEARCPRCGQPVRPGVRFCGNCGATLAALAAPAVPAATIPCPQCGSAVRSGARFCPVCGSQVSGVPPAPPPAPPHWSPPPLPPQWAPPPPPASPWSPPAAAVSVGQGYSRAYLLRHALWISLLALSLILALGGVYAWDKQRPIPQTTPTPPDLPTPFPSTPTPALAYPDDVVEIGYSADGHFGLRTTLGDPDRQDDDGKWLTYSFEGDTSNTRISVDGQTPIYGSYEGQFLQSPEEGGGVVTSAWEFQKVRTTQKVEIVAGSTTHLLDTMRIEYVLENQDSRAHEVGLRVMIDTLIGDNDGVPFVVPGRSGITGQAVDLAGAQIPDFIQALEQADLVNPGVIVHLTLKGGEATPPDRVVISGWYGTDMPWDFIDGAGGVGAPLERRMLGLFPIPDSAVGLYYDPATLGPGEARTIVVFYGLGGISSTETHNPTLSLTFAGRVNEGDSFWVVAMVVDPVEGQSLRLELPDGLGLVPGETVEKAVIAAPGNTYTQVSWLVEASRAIGDSTIRVTLVPDGLTEEQSITVLGKGITR